MPEVEVTARSVVGELAAEADMAGLPFDSEDFNRRFAVLAEDARFAHELIDPRMVEALLACPEDLHVHFGPEPDDRLGAPRNPEGLIPILDAAATLDQRVPVIAKHETASPRCGPEPPAREPPER